MVNSDEIAYLFAMLNSGIRLSNLTLSYQRRPAVHHLSGTFPEGSMTAIMGPNGGGKSTLIKALAGLHPIDEGSIDRSPSLELSATTYLPQGFQWDRQFPLSVYDLVEQALTPELGLWKSKSKEQRARIDQALEQVDLWPLRNQSIERLSLGQFQRALFARVIVQNARVVLLDEPLTGLDERSSDALFDLIHGWNQQGKTLIVVLHDRSLAHKHFQTTLVLAGENFAWGPSENVLHPTAWKDVFTHKAPHFSFEECHR